MPDSEKILKKKTLDTMVGWDKSAKGSALMHLNIYIIFDIVYQPTKFNIGPYGLLANEWDKVFIKVCLFTNYGLRSINIWTLSNLYGSLPESIMFSYIMEKCIEQNMKFWLIKIEYFFQVRSSLS